MPPPRPALAQSESKARFFERLSLDGRSEAHKQLYAMMKEEAVAGRRRVTNDTNSLAPHFRNDSSIEPPYSSSQISETAFHREILTIYRQARPETKWIYDMGRDTDRVEEENWVVRWMLWHVFRYRDHRNRNRRAAPTASDKGEADADDSPEETTGSQRRPPLPQSADGSSRPTRYWDPVRDG